MSARFKIKRHGLDVVMRAPWVLRDRTRPAYLGQYRTHERALAAMDNIIRVERGVPPRLALAPGQAREAASA